MNIVLINLTRFGDLLQSQAAVRALRFYGLDPGAAEHRVALVCLANFSFTSDFLQGLDLVHPLPKDAFLSELEREGGACARPGWSRSLEELWQWRAELWQKFPPDLVCNLTPSLPARILARFLSPQAAQSGPLRAAGPQTRATGGQAELAEAQATAPNAQGRAAAGPYPDTGPSAQGFAQGFAIDEHGFDQTPPWAAFMLASSRQRGASPFNIVDLFRAVSGTSSGRPGDALLRAPGPEIRAEMGRRLEAEAASLGGWAGELAGRKGFVGLQCGASAEIRRWPSEYFARLGARLWQEEKLVPVLFGSADEQGLTRRYAELSASIPGAAHPHLDLAGRTSLKELAAALTHCTLLVSNDTGTLHLAAGLDRPVLGIFLATAQPWDTGPARAGSLSLEPGLDCHPCEFGRPCPHGGICRLAVGPDAAFALARAALRGQAEALGKSPAFGLELARINAKDPLRKEKTAQAFQAEGEDAFAARPRAWLTGLDEYGFMALSSLSGHGGEARSAWMLSQRAFLRQFLDRNPALPFAARPEALAPLPEESAQAVAREAETLVSLLTLLVELGGLLGQSGAPALRERFLAALRRVDAAFGGAVLLSALSALWAVEIQERGSDLDEALLCATQYRSLLSAIAGRYRTDAGPGAGTDTGPDTGPGAGR